MTKGLCLIFYNFTQKEVDQINNSFVYFKNRTLFTHAHTLTVLKMIVRKNSEHIIVCKDFDFNTVKKLFPKSEALEITDSEIFETPLRSTLGKAFKSKSVDPLIEKLLSMLRNMGADLRNDVNNPLQTLISIAETTQGTEESNLAQQATSRISDSVNQLEENLVKAVKNTF